MIVDLHNHTTLCKHAVGTIDEYIKNAIKAKTKFFGISDHAPMNFDQAYRMDFDEMDKYEKMVLEARQKFKNECEILLGYEVDYLENFMDERVFRRKVDYFIGSVHFLGGWGFDNPEFIGEYENRDIDEIWRGYFRYICELAKCGKFDIVGHFDLLKVFKFLPKTDVRILANDALNAIKKANLVVEINSAGFRKPVCEQYPSRMLLEQIFELNIPITFGSDAHSPDQVNKNGDECVKIAKEIGFSEAICFKNCDRFAVKF
ncbi:histidinol-phosphatase [Campylobacter mucosalis]|uniref:Histidinol-phosphatase n=1 Tax=Campylobacter mucosalis CCUG 21559 TaxID=1032067 RepID=A0A6G5QIR3_9BACT|nr:histidinol-phosphatase [Campylobacter mucosalis]QCD45504.1 histidinol-phosphate phosphatase [Campylobacter mucosalis CCUG 21559]